MRRLFLVIHRLEEVVLATAMIAIAAITILNVFARNLLNHNLAAAEELNQFLIVLVCFVGLSYAASQGRHIRMTALFDQLSTRSRKRLILVISGSTSALMFVLAWYALKYALAVEMVSPVLDVPLRYVYLTAPVGLVLGGIQHGLTFARNLTTPEVYISFDHPEGYQDAEEIQEI